MREKVIFDNYILRENGTVFSIKRNKEMALSKVNGYYVVGLQVNKKQKHFYVHRLLAENFIPNPENKPHVNHINGDRGDNRLDNIEWCTPSENTKNSIDRKTHISLPMNNPCYKNIETSEGYEWSVISIDELEASIAMFKQLGLEARQRMLALRMSQNELCEYLGVHRSYVNELLAGRRIDSVLWNRILKKLEMI